MSRGKLASVQSGQQNVHLELGREVSGKRTLEKESILAMTDFGSLKGRGCFSWFPGPIRGILVIWTWSVAWAHSFRYQQTFPKNLPSSGMSQMSKTFHESGTILPSGCLGHHQCEVHGINTNTLRMQKGVIHSDGKLATKVSRRK